MEAFLEKMKTMDLENPAELSMLQKIEKDLGFSLPEDYIRFMLLHNGGEGPVGEYGYLAVWGTDEIQQFYQEAGIGDALPPFFFFASDRSGYLYAYDFRDSDIKIIEIPDDPDEMNEIKTVASSFSEFIDYIYAIDDSEYEDILSEVDKDAHLLS